MLLRILLQENPAFAQATQNVFIPISGKGKLTATPAFASLCQARYSCLASTMDFI